MNAPGRPLAARTAKPGTAAAIKTNRPVLSILAMFLLLSGHGKSQWDKKKGGWRNGGGSVVLAAESAKPRPGLD